MVFFCSATLFYYAPPVLENFIFSSAFTASAFISPKTALLAIDQTFSNDMADNEIETIPDFKIHTFEDEIVQPVPEDTSSPTPVPVKPDTIPEGMGVIVEEQFRTSGTGDRYIQTGAGYLRNLTDLTPDQITPHIMQDLPFDIELNSSQPQVLIMHSHATESFETYDLGYFDPQNYSRNTDYTQNITSAGEIITNILNQGGINTLQDTTYHDYPQYNGSYDRSIVTVQEYLDAYPSIKVVLDVHRDAVERDGTRVKPTCVVGEKKAAQLMIICCADNGNGTQPNFTENLKFASRLQDSVASNSPSLTRPILFDYRNYNQHLTTGSLLLEIGGHANTLAEVHYTAELVATALVELFTTG